MGSTRAQPGGSWHPDADGDGEVWTQDLLELLAAFGGSWPLRASAVPNPCAAEGSVRYQGEEYAVVAIGEQCWFAENLRATRYANGEPLWANLSSPEWLSADVGAVAVYGEGAARVYAGSADERANLAAFGRLYNGWGGRSARTLSCWLACAQRFGLGAFDRGIGWAVQRRSADASGPAESRRFRRFAWFQCRHGRGAELRRILRERGGARLLLVDGLGRADGMVHAVGGWGAGCRWSLDEPRNGRVS